MAEQVRPAHGKPTTTLALQRPLSSIGFRARAFHHGPDRTRSSRDAEDTFAVQPLSPRSIQRQLLRLAALLIDTFTTAVSLWFVALHSDNAQWGSLWLRGVLPATIGEAAPYLVPPVRCGLRPIVTKFAPKGARLWQGLRPCTPFRIGVHLFA